MSPSHRIKHHDRAMKRWAAKSSAIETADEMPPPGSGWSPCYRANQKSNAAQSRFNSIVNSHHYWFGRELFTIHISIRRWIDEQDAIRANRLRRERRRWYRS